MQNNYSDEIRLFDLIENNNISEEHLSQQIKEIEEYLETNKSNKIIQNSYEMTVKPCFRHITDIHSFNGLELNKLHELMGCLINSSAIYHKPSKHIIEIFNYNSFMYYQGELVTTTVKKGLKYVRNMKSLDNVCDSDKISLIKYRCLDGIYIKLWHSCTPDKSEVIYIVCYISGFLILYNIFNN